MNKCDNCGQETSNAPQFLKDENWWEPPFCDECEASQEERIARIKEQALKYKDREPDWSKYECKGCGTLGCYGGCHTMDDQTEHCTCNTDEHCYVHDIKVCGDCGLHHSQPNCPECGCGEAEDAAYKEDEPSFPDGDSDDGYCPCCGSIMSVARSCVCFTG